MFGTYTLSWKWAFEGTATTDKADTLLGALAATPSAFSYVLGTDYQTGIGLTLTATVTQID